MTTWDLCMRMDNQFTVFNYVWKLICEKQSRDIDEWEEIWGWNEYLRNPHLPF